MPCTHVQDNVSEVAKAFSPHRCRSRCSPPMLLRHNQIKRSPSTWPIWRHASRVVRFECGKKENRMRNGSLWKVVPSVLTTANLFFGVYGIIAALREDFYQAALGILVGVL